MSNTSAANRTRFDYFFFITFALLLLFALTLVSGHQSKTYGNWKLSVGFLVEPAWSLGRNGVDLTITLNNTAFAGATVSAVVTYGSNSTTYALSAVYGSAGKYKAEFIPTKSGSYSFSFIGTLSQPNEVDLVMDGSANYTFICSGSTFSCAADSPSFPDPVWPSVVDVAATANRALLLAGSSNGTAALEKADLALSVAYAALSNSTTALNIAREALAAAQTNSNSVPEMRYSFPIFAAFLAMLLLRR